MKEEEIEEELKKNRYMTIQQRTSIGIHKDLSRGRINQLIDLVKQNLLSIETAAQCAKMTVVMNFDCNEKKIINNSQTRTGMRHHNCRIPVPLAYKLIYYYNEINILRSNYKLNNSAFLLFHNPI